MSVVTIQRSPSPIKESEQQDVVDAGELIPTDVSCNKSSSASEDFLAVKGAALALPQGSRRRESLTGSQDVLTNLELHLQMILRTLRSTESLKIAITLENVSTTPDDNHRYLCLVSCNGRQGTEECALLGMDITSEEATFGLVLPLLQDMRINPDGDGGFKVFNKDFEHHFKPASVQALWSAIQHVEQVLVVARRNNYYSSGLNHVWISYYKSRIRSSRQHINEWHRTDDSEEQLRSASPPREGEEADERRRVEHEIRSKLREIMVSVDLDDVTVHDLRKRLAAKMDCDLNPYKKFIGDSVLFILGQLDSPTLIFDHLYLGSKWNACNLEELEKNGVKYILNITREIDNFFMDVMKEYKNIREFDEETTDLLQYWEDTHRFINKARDDKSRVLVHCKMGVSRSASTVMAYAMKECGWSLKKAKEYVTSKRSCVYPNKGFMKQLELYEGMLTARSNRSKFNEDSIPIAPGGIRDKKARYSSPGGGLDLLDDAPEEPLDPEPINVENDIFQFKQQGPLRSVDMISAEQISAQSGKSSTRSSALSNRSIAADPMDEGCPGSPFGSGCGGADPRIADVKIVRPDVIEPRNREEAPWRRSLRSKSGKNSNETLPKSSRCSSSPPQNSGAESESNNNGQTGVNRRLRADSSWIQSSEDGMTCRESTRPHSLPSVSLSTTETPHFFLGGDIAGEESSTDPSSSVSGWLMTEQLTRSSDVPSSDGLRPGFVQEQSNRLQSLKVDREDESGVRRENEDDPAGDFSTRYFSDILWWFCESTDQTPGNISDSSPSSYDPRSIRYSSLNTPGDSVPAIHLTDTGQLAQESSSDPQATIDPQLAALELTRPVWHAKKHLKLIRQVGDEFVKSDSSTSHGRRVRHIVTKVESSVDREPIRPVSQLVQKFREEQPAVRKRQALGQGLGLGRRASDYEQRRRCRSPVDKKKDKERGIRQNRFRSWGKSVGGEAQVGRRHKNSIYNTM